MLRFVSRNATNYCFWKFEIFFPDVLSSPTTMETPIIIVHGCNLLIRLTWRSWFSCQPTTNLLFRAVEIVAGSTAVFCDLIGWNTEVIMIFNVIVSFWFFVWQTYINMSVQFSNRIMITPRLFNRLVGSRAAEKKLMTHSWQESHKIFSTNKFNKNVLMI